MIAEKFAIILFADKLIKIAVLKKLNFVFSCWNKSWNKKKHYLSGVNVPRVFPDWFGRFD
jgi:hypothetical protein